MRTTITLEPEAEALVKRAMRQRGWTLDQAVNHAIGAALASKKRATARTPTFRMGFEQLIPCDKALRIAGEIDDDELVRRLAARSEQWPSPHRRVARRISSTTLIWRLALEHGAEIVSFDRDVQRFAGVRWSAPA